MRTPGETAELDAEIARLKAEDEAAETAYEVEVHVEIDEDREHQLEREVEDARYEAKRRAARTKAEAMEARAAAKATAVGKVMKLRKVPTFSRVRVIGWGSVEEVDEDITFAVDDVVTVWTKCASSSNSFSATDVRGVFGTDHELQWLPDDAKVEIVDLPRFAGDPKVLTRDLKPVPAPAGSRGTQMPGVGTLVTRDGFHPWIWENELVFSPVQGWDDPETSVEVLLCALNVAPDLGDLRTQLLAAIRARYARMRKLKDTYPPREYPWRDSLVPGRATLKYLAG